MIQNMMIAQAELQRPSEGGMTPQEKEPVFLAYLKEKAERKVGRPHLVRRLGVEKTLMILRDIYVRDIKPPTVAKNYGIDYKSLWRFLKELEQNGYTNEIKDYFSRMEDVETTFDNHPLIQKWKKRIIISGHHSQLKHVSTLKRVLTGKICKDFRCSLDDFDLEKAQEFIYLCHQNNIEVKRHVIMAIRHFLMVAKEIHIPRGMGAMYGLSGEKVSYGKYAHIRLSEDEINAIEEYLRDHYSEEGWHLAFRFGVETCSRMMAILTVPQQYIQFVNHSYAICKVFETKVKPDSKWKGLKGKWWTKYIPTWLAEEMLEFAKKKGRREFIFIKDTEKLSKNTLRTKYGKQFSKALKEAYQHVGITEPYFYRKPVHALRHVGAIRLLNATNWNYSLVAKIGGWTDVNTLKDCYGAIPDEIVEQTVRTIYGGRN